MLETLILNKPNKQLPDDLINKIKISFEENYAAEGVKLLLNGVSAALIENAWENDWILKEGL